MLFLFPGPETSESWLTFIGRMEVLVQLAWLRVALQGVALGLRKGHFNEKRFQDRHESGTVVMEWKQDTGVSTRVSGRAASLPLPLVLHVTCLPMSGETEQELPLRAFAEEEGPAQCKLKPCVSSVPKSILCF